MKLKLIPAAALCAAMLIQTLPACAITDSDHFALSIRTSEGTVPDDRCFHISAEDAVKGTTLHLGVFVESESSALNRLGVRLRSDSASVTFANPLTATDTISESEITYLLPDGTAFSTKLQPYCFGTLGVNAAYLPDCMECKANLMSDTDLYVYWLYGIGNAKGFLGGKSDLFSFCTFDAVIAPGTKAGTYTIGFLADETVHNPEIEHLTSSMWDAGTPSEPEYHRVMPALKDVKIVVDGAAERLKGDVTNDGRINAEDATEVLVYAAMLGTGGAEISESRHADMKQYGDVSGDGVVNANDATGILRYAAAIGTNTPVTWESLFA